jgi:CheY-like chemotaxis protein
LKNPPLEDISSPSKSILIIVRDAKVGLFLAEAIKKETMHHAILAVDEHQALEVIQEMKPDLFILDCEFSNIESFELYDHLHTAEGFESVPAILSNISTPFSRRSLKKRYNKGKEKPPELEDLLHAIQEMLA